jgi:hypothetical protein
LCVNNLEEQQKRKNKLYETLTSKQRNWKLEWSLSCQGNSVIKKIITTNTRFIVCSFTNQTKHALYIVWLHWIAVYPTYDWENNLFIHVKRPLQLLVLNLPKCLVKILKCYFIMEPYCAQRWGQSRNASLYFLITYIGHRSNMRLWLDRSK